MWSKLKGEFILILVTTIMVKTFLDFLMFDQIFLSPQVKRGVIISNKHVISKIPNESPNDLGSSDIRKFQENLKTS